MVAIDSSYWRVPGQDYEREPLDDPLPSEQLTELGHARRIVAAAGTRLRHVSAWQSWLEWDGRQWTVDEGGVAQRAAKAVARAVTRRTAGDLTHGGGDDATAKAALKAALRLESSSAVRGALALAATELGVAITPDQLDAHPTLLNVSNGVLDLETGDLLDHDPELLLTKLAPAAYQPDATAAVFETFLDRIQPDAAMRAFLARLLGYGLLGTVAEHTMPIWYGAGQNGKSTLIAAVMGALGDYAITTDPALLIDRGYDSHPTGAADLFGRRAAFTHETDAGRALAEATVKRLTGGDRIRARRMRQDFWEYEPSHLLIMVTNHLPTVRGTDEGIWRRLPVVPFTVQIPKGEQDTELPARLAAERDGILAWMMRGHAEWRRSGLAAPEEVAEATARYRHGQDALARFLDERTHAAPTGKVRSTALFGEWGGWCGGEGVETGTQTAFSTALEERGFVIAKSNGVKVVRGLSLLILDKEE